MRAVLALAVAMLAHPAFAQEPVRLYAAGSLRAALNEVAAAFTAASGVKIVAEYGPSGLLRDRIAKGCLGRPKGNRAA